MNRPRGLERSRKMRPALYGHSHRVASLLASGICWLVLCGAAGAEEGAALHELDPFHARSAGAADLVLMLRIGGGYGNFLTQEFRLYGDGRLEERRLREPWVKSKPPELRDLFFDAEQADDLLRRLIRSDVVGLTDERLLAVVQERYPAVESLLAGSDCGSTTLELHLFERTRQSAEWSRAESHLRIECIYAYPRAYPAVPAACAIHDLQSRFYALTEAKRKP